MGFHEVQFPTTISRSSQSGPSTFTNIIRIDSGGEERVSRWNTPIWRGDAQQGIKKLEDAQAVLKFYRARNGPEFGFRYKDWADYATSPTGSTWAPGDVAVTATDVLIGTGDASEVSFQLIKNYVSGPTTVVRNLTKIVSGTVLVSLDDVTKTEGADYSVNYNTGIITFTSAPGAGVAVKAGCEFDVPVRFGQDVDVDGLMVAIRGFNNAEIGSVPLIEIIDGLEVQDLYFFGGAVDVDTAINFSHNLQDGRVVTVNPTASGVKMLIPGTKDNLPAGGIYWFVKNRHGSNSMEIRDGTAGGTLVATLAAGVAKMVVMGFDSGGAKKWYAF